MKPTTLRMDPALAWPAVARLPAVRRSVLTVGLIALTALLYTFTRVESRAMAVHAGVLQAEAGALRAENERLALEYATLENPRALELRAQRMGLVATVPLVEVR